MVSLFIVLRNYNKRVNELYDNFLIFICDKNENFEFISFIEYIY